MEKEGCFVDSKQGISEGGLQCCGKKMPKNAQLLEIS